MKKPGKQFLAAALQYEQDKDKAPRITAKGKGLIAEKIIELARENDIPIQQDPGLVQILCKLDIDEEIPVELYRAIAELLAFVYSINERRRDS
ncbi:MAG: EscU/YscU/HrcU family type III secretion system export apparatus switch protein [Deltaproteobacteria bacterium]|nr:EscU/YscU/HrcU family type III secretion system export apparatus switch protein [Deltaproteobacteria bacterium]